MYGIKIDKRKKNAIKLVRKDLIQWIDNDKVWVDESSSAYVEKQFAKRYETHEEAYKSITEDFEMVCKL